MSVSKAYSGIIHLQTHSTKHQFISNSLDSAQARRSKIKIKPPTDWLAISFNLTSLPYIHSTFGIRNKVGFQAILFFKVSISPAVVIVWLGTRTDGSDKVA